MNEVTTQTVNVFSTCRMNGISALDYLKRFFQEIVKGQRDYENPFAHDYRN